jgi:demethylmenaquinone methyltransferase/2-methoxy-6-polyprenyl-1,4-benzoquinol methylase
MDPGTVARIVQEFGAEGDVLELACGEGAFTRHLVRVARSVTAVDSSGRMLERNRARTGAGVRFVEADLFDWRPDRTYDAVFFANWLSHVPPSLFEGFWDLVRDCVTPTGRAGFVDEDDRAMANDERGQVAGVPAATRTLADGRRFEVVKVFWRAEELEQRLRRIGWDAAVRRVDETFLFGVASQRRG